MSLNERRSRLNIFIEPAHARRLDQVSALKGVSKSAVIAAAIASFLSPDGGDQREAALAKRLDRLSRQFDRLERDQNILIETVALYLRHYLTLAIPVPESQQDAMRAQGRARYTQFIDQLARHIQRGRSLVREIHEEIGPEVQPASSALNAESCNEPPSDEGAKAGNSQNGGLAEPRETDHEGRQ